MLAITFLGTGTSMGVPVILCDCPVCRSGDPRDQRFRSSIYVETPSNCFIIDTGAEFRIQALRARIHRVDSVLYTHSHADHVMGFDDLRRFSTLNGNRLPVYASAETMENLSRIFYYAFSGEAQFPGYVRPEPHLIEGPFKLGDNEIVPIPLEHGKAHVFGFLVRQKGIPRLAYLSDCKSVKGNIELLNQVDTLILGTPCFAPHPTHMSLEEGVALSRRLAAGVTYLTHLSHDFLYAEVEAQLPQGVHLAYDGLRVEL